MVVIIEMMIIVTVERDKRSKAKSTYANQLFLKTRERRRERGGSTSSNLLVSVYPGKCALYDL